ncbi:hypothetical protein [Aquabacter spiritensis]|uniref:Uncharacterized protein n=1 Tax=Aquabacter spiritensis TaxID=933073 RepID=A0A4R3LPF5_9HYPH|nr:hypothetical protein [Aquabacter spiritensis]TCT02051.1 hypothetical protein EDC64_11582 [Aquabacter spiritensis]
MAAESTSAGLAKVTNPHGPSVVGSMSVTLSAPRAGTTVPAMKLSG